LAVADILDHLYAELDVEEGEKSYVYDDVTGKRVIKDTTLVGNLSVAVGVNLSLGLDSEEVKWLSQHRMQKVLTQLGQFKWFATLDEVRQVALADIAFNIGIVGLLHWPKFLADLISKDFSSAAKEIRNNTLWVSQVKITRATRIESMILTGSYPSG
jgi:GH24 family phage-related lysozyme (muramidase)